MKTGIKRSIYLVAIAHQGLIHRARRETSTLRQRYYLSKMVPFQRRSFLKFCSFFFFCWAEESVRRALRARQARGWMLKKIPPTLIPMPPPLARGALAFARQRNEENKTTPVLQTKKRMNSEIIFFLKLLCILIWHKDSALVYKTLCSSYFSCACPGMYRAFLPLVLRFIQPQNFEDKDCVPNLYSVAWSEPKSQVFGFP